MRHRSLALLAAAPLAAALLTGCSQSSPTEPAIPTLEQSSASSFAESAPAADADSSETATLEKRRGGRGGGSGSSDDSGGRRGRGRGGRGRGGNDDRPGNVDPRPTPTPRNGQEFEARVTGVAGNVIELAGGGRVLVDAATVWSARGDLFNLQAVAGSLASGDITRVEGRGTRQADGATRAASIKAEVDRR
jgi:hypothetical protein